MKLKQFINELKKLEEMNGGELEVAMADFLPVVSPVVIKSKHVGTKVIITDEE